MRKRGYPRLLIGHALDQSLQTIELQRFELRALERFEGRIEDRHA